MLRESVGRLAPAPDSSAEEAYVWGSCLRYDGAHKTFLGHVAQQSYIHQHVLFLFLLKHHALRHFICTINFLRLHIVSISDLLMRLALDRSVT